MPKPGQAQIRERVIYVDEYRQEHEALVTNQFGDVIDPDNTYSVNLVYVDPSEGATDQHGRQLIRKSSVPPQRWQSANANYWKWPE